MEKIKYAKLRFKVASTIINYNKFIIPLLMSLMVVSLFSIYSLLSFGIANNNSIDRYSHYKIKHPIKYSELDAILNTHSYINFRMYLDENQNFFFSQGNHLHVVDGEEIQASDTNAAVLGLFREGNFSNKRVGDSIMIDDIEYKVKGLSLNQNTIEITKPISYENLEIYYVLIGYEDSNTKSISQLRTRLDHDFKEKGFEVIYDSNMNIPANKLYYIIAFMLICVSLFPFILLIKYSFDKSKTTIDVFKLIGISSIDILLILTLILFVILFSCFLVSLLIFILVQDKFYISIQYSLFNFAYYLRSRDYLLIFAIIVSLFLPLLIAFYYKVFKKRSFINEKN